MTGYPFSSLSLLIYFAFLSLHTKFSPPSSLPSFLSFADLIYSVPRSCLSSPIKSHYFYTLHRPFLSLLYTTVSLYLHDLSFFPDTLPFFPSTSLSVTFLLNFPRFSHFLFLTTLLFPSFCPFFIFLITHASWKTSSSPESSLLPYLFPPSSSSTYTVLSLFSSPLLFPFLLLSPCLSPSPNPSIPPFTHPSYPSPRIPFLVHTYLIPVGTFPQSPFKV